MDKAYIHQAIHGYLDGHRLMSSSTPLPSDAARAMLVLSDMSGPSMQSCFDDYLTAYPLSGTDFYVFARTWNAPEMPRPGCVWTHSLLIPRSRLAEVSTTALLVAFRRPSAQSAENGAKEPIEVAPTAVCSSIPDVIPDETPIPAIISAVFGQPRPVIVVAETSSQYEPIFLQIWEMLWPSEKARFSFCTGALTPRSNAGSLLDLQAVPRTIPPSQFRKMATAAVVVDQKVTLKPEAWVNIVLENVAGGWFEFRAWLETTIGPTADRSNVARIAPIYAKWKAEDSPAESMVLTVLTQKGLAPIVRSQLITLAFHRAEIDLGVTGKRRLLHFVSCYGEKELEKSADIFLSETRDLFDKSRDEGIGLVSELFGSTLSTVGESILRTAVLLLTPEDLESFDNAQSPYLPAIVCANQHLAFSPQLWSLVGAKGSEILSLLGNTDLVDADRAEILDAIIESRHEISADALIRFGGTSAIHRGLSAIASGQLPLSLTWRTALNPRLDSIVDWLETLQTPNVKHLELASRFLSPRATQARLSVVWKNTARCLGDQIPTRVCAFGLALAFWEGSITSPLFSLYFQSTFDAAGSSRLDYDEWDWLREWAPPKTFWREWDRCERLAGAVARLMAKQNASVETMMEIVRSTKTIRKVVELLEDDYETRQYIKDIRVAVKYSFTGTPEQKNAILATMK